MKKGKYLVSSLVALYLISYLVRVSSRIMENMKNVDFGLANAAGLGIQTLSILFIIALVLFIGQNVIKFFIEIKGEDSVDQELANKLEKLRKIIMESYRIIYKIVLAFFGGFVFLSYGSDPKYVIAGIVLIGLSLYLVFVSVRKITDIWNE